MIILESTYDGGGTILEQALMTNAEAGVDKQAVKFVSGRLTKVAVGDTPNGVLHKDTEAGTDVETDFIRVREDQVYLIDYVGTATPTVGEDYSFDASGQNLDADSLSGKILVVSVDTSVSKARVRFNKA